MYLLINLRAIFSFLRFLPSALGFFSFGAAFFIPGVREFSLCCGCLDASKSVLTRAIVERKENIILLPGGEKEMMLTDGSSKVTKLVLGERTGFVRLAITHGMSLVPGFCFGEKWVHEAVRLPTPVRSFLYKRAPNAARRIVPRLAKHGRARHRPARAKIHLY